jgi:hypothetical protein
MFRRLSLALVLVLGASRAQAQDTAAMQAMDARVHAAIFRTIDTGFRLFNANDQAGCYRIYQGSLLALAPLLDYRAELKDTVEQGLADSERLPDVASRAFALRKTLDAVYAATTDRLIRFPYALGGAEDPQWRANVTGLLGLAHDEQRLFLFGNFTSVSAEPRAGVAALPLIARYFLDGFE